MYRRPKTAKINLGLNHRVKFRSRPYMTIHPEYLLNVSVSVSANN